jgi:hypothetical protein
MSNRYYSQGKPKDPIREVLHRIVGKEPPPFVQGYDYSNLTDRQYEQLQSWVLNSLSGTELYWSTGIGILEAAQNIVAEAVANANIPPKEEA